MHPYKYCTVVMLYPSLPPSLPFSITHTHPPSLPLSLTPSLPPLPLIQFFAVALAVGGIVLFSYQEGFGSATAVGVILSVGSAVGAALYKVREGGREGKRREGEEEEGGREGKRREGEEEEGGREREGERERGEERNREGEESESKELKSIRCF